MRCEALYWHQSPTSPQETWPKLCDLQVENYPSSYATVKVVQADPLAWKGDLLVVGIYSCCIKAEGEIRTNFTGNFKLASANLLHAMPDSGAQEPLQGFFHACAQQGLTCLPAGFVAHCPV